MRSLATLLLATALAACGPGLRGDPADGPSPAAFTADRIVTDQLTENQLNRDVFTLVRDFNPGFLQRYGTRGTGDIVTIVNGVRSGGMDVLRSIHATNVQEIRFLNAMDATQRYGVMTGGGAILVTTRSGYRR